MDYAAAATNAPAPAPVPSGTNHAHHPHPYAGYSPSGAYHQPAPATYPTAAAVASSSYYYPVPAAVPSTAVQYDPYLCYQHYSPPEGGGAAGAGLVGYYFTVGEASQQAAVTSTTQAVPVATTKEAGRQFGFDPQRYAQAAVARASNGITQPAAAPVLHHAQWNAHFGHPVPKYALRKQMKKKPKALQPAPCEVCKIQCDTLDVLMIHKQGKKHKKNLEKLQDSITPKPSNVIGPSMAPTVVSNCVVSSVQPKKKKSSSSGTLEDLEVKKRRVLEAGAAQDEVRICRVCNVIVNSQKVYEFHVAGQKHQAMIQKQQALHFVT